MTHHVSHLSHVHDKTLIDAFGTDYEQQRRQLLHKHGIDLDDGNAFRGTRRMDKKDIELILGAGDGQAGIFTWREKNRKKVRWFPCSLPFPRYHVRDTTVSVFCVSPFSSSRM